MTRKLASLDVFSLGLLGGGAAVTAAVYARLPESMPTHFDLHDVPNGWMPRAEGAWAVLAIALVAWGILRFGGALLPSAWRARASVAPMGAAAFVMTALLVTVHMLALYAALHPGAPIARATVLAVGATWVALGQIMPRLRRNPFVGVRTTWTLTSDENWLRTHRVAAYTFAAGGCVALLAGALGGASGGSVAIAAIVLSALAPAVYSYFLARSLPPES